MKYFFEDLKDFSQLEQIKLSLYARVGIFDASYPTYFINLKSNLTSLFQALNQPEKNVQVYIVNVAKHLTVFFSLAEKIQSGYFNAAPDVKEHMIVLRKKLYALHLVIRPLLYRNDNSTLRACRAKYLPAWLVNPEFLDRYSHFEHSLLIGDFCHSFRSYAQTIDFILAGPVARQYTINIRVVALQFVRDPTTRANRAAYYFPQDKKAQFKLEINQYVAHYPTLKKDYTAVTEQPYTAVATHEDKMRHKKLEDSLKRGMGAVRITISAILHPAVCPMLTLIYSPSERCEMLLRFWNNNNAALENFKQEIYNQIARSLLALKVSPTPYTADLSGMLLEYALSDMAVALKLFDDCARDQLTSFQRATIVAHYSSKENFLPRYLRTTLHMSHAGTTTAKTTPEFRLWAIDDWQACHALFLARDSNHQPLFSDSDYFEILITHCNTEDFAVDRMFRADLIGRISGLFQSVLSVTRSPTNFFGDLVHNTGQSFISNSHFDANLMWLVESALGDCFVIFLPMYNQAIDANHQIPTATQDTRKQNARTVCTQKNARLTNLALTPRRAAVANPSSLPASTNTFHHGLNSTIDSLDRQMTHIFQLIQAIQSGKQQQLTLTLEIDFSFILPIGINKIAKENASKYTHHNHSVTLLKNLDSQINIFLDGLERLILLVKKHDVLLDLFVAYQHSVYPKKNDKDYADPKDWNITRATLNAQLKNQCALSTQTPIDQGINKLIFVLLAKNNIHTLSLSAKFFSHDDSLLLQRLFTENTSLQTVNLGFFDRNKQAAASSHLQRYDQSEYLTDYLNQFIVILHQSPVRELNLLYCRYTQQCAEALCRLVSANVNIQGVQYPYCYNNHPHHNNSNDDNAVYTPEQSDYRHLDLASSEVKHIVSQCAKTKIPQTNPALPPENVLNYLFYHGIMDDLTRRNCRFNSCLPSAHEIDPAVEAEIIDADTTLVLQTTQSNAALLFQYKKLKAYAALHDTYSCLILCPFDFDEDMELTLLLEITSVFYSEMCTHSQDSALVVLLAQATLYWCKKITEHPELPVLPAHTPSIHRIPSRYLGKLHHCYWVVRMNRFIAENRLPRHHLQTANPTQTRDIFSLYQTHLDALDASFVKPYRQCLEKHENLLTLVKPSDLKKVLLTPTQPDKTVLIAFIAKTCGMSWQQYAAAINGLLRHTHCVVAQVTTLNQLFELITLDNQSPHSSYKHQTNAHQVNQQLLHIVLIKKMLLYIVSEAIVSHRMTPQLRTLVSNRLLIADFARNSLTGSALWGVTNTRAQLSLLLAAKLAVGKDGAKPNEKNVKAGRNSETNKPKKKAGQENQLTRVSLPELPNWQFDDVPGDGNCFYRALAQQLQLQGHSITQQTHQQPLYDQLRRQVEQGHYQNGRYADTAEIYAAIRCFNVIIAIVDTRSPHVGFLAHYYDGSCVKPENEPNHIPTNRTVARLAYTGNHYLSVISHPALINGALRDPCSLQTSATQVVAQSAEATARPTAAL